MGLQSTYVNRAFYTKQEGVLSIVVAAQAEYLLPTSSYKEQIELFVEQIDAKFKAYMRMTCQSFFVWLWKALIAGILFIALGL